MIQSGFWQAYRYRILFALILLTVALRSAAVLLMAAPLESDAAGYFAMAKSLAEHNALHTAFLSTGYPLFLAPFFKLFGSAPEVGLWLNVALSVPIFALIHQCMKRLSPAPWAPILAVAAFAVYLPSIVYCGYLLKETLATALLLAQLLIFLDFERLRRPGTWTVCLGALYAMTLLTSPSALAFGAIALAVLGWTGRRWHWPMPLLYIASILVFLSPWLVFTQKEFGRPILNTNSGFNLYIGNNRDSNGLFMSIQDTEWRGEPWRAFTGKYSELQRNDILKDIAVRYMIEHPARTVELAIQKLGLFWMPPVHEGKGGNKSQTETIVRKLWLLQYIALVLLSLAPLLKWRSLTRRVWIVYGCILGFWLLHGIVYIIYRYREPIMPFLILLAVIGVERLLPRRQPQ